MSGDAPLITALVCTRDRGNSPVATVRSVLAGAHPDFELIVVDQSTGDGTARALAPFLSDPRLRFLRQQAQGVGRARNLGLREARGAVVALTDDDCEVPPDWLQVMGAVFAAHPTVAVAFCNVEAGPHDAALGFIPAYRRVGDKLLSGVRDKCAARGIGAGIAVRREAVLALGGFDERMGPGAEFPACEEGDLAVRALLRGYGVYETDAVAVRHAGFRTWEEGKALSRRDWLGIGAAYAKPLRCGHWRFLAVPAYELGRFALWPPVSDLLHLRAPRGLGRAPAFFRGFARAWRTPIDPETLLFRPAEMTARGAAG